MKLLILGLYFGPPCMLHKNMFWAQSCSFQIKFCSRLSEFNIPAIYFPCIFALSKQIFLLRKIEKKKEKKKRENNNKKNQKELCWFKPFWLQGVSRCIRLLSVVVVVPSGSWNGSCNSTPGMPIHTWAASLSLFIGRSTVFFTVICYEVNLSFPMILILTVSFCFPL